MKISHSLEGSQTAVAGAIIAIETVSFVQRIMSLQMDNLSVPYALKATLPNMLPRLVQMSFFAVYFCPIFIQFIHTNKHRVN